MNNSIQDIKGAIFDLDGTLLNSMHIWSQVGLLFLKGKGFEPPDGLEDKFVKMSIVQAAEYYVENIDSSETIDGVVNGINELVRDFYFYEVEKKEGVEEFLCFLKERNVKMCIATATDKFLVEKALKRNGIDKYFSEIFTCTSVGAGKDTPIIYNKALEHLDTPKDNTFVFEDALYAIKTATNAGYKVVGIQDVFEKASPEKIAELCDYYIDGYADIYKFFQS